jgi:hypothetical protein
LETSTVFRPVLESSRLSLCGSDVNDAHVGSWRGCFIMSWLGDNSFPCGMMRWMG